VSECHREAYKKEKRIPRLFMNCSAAADDDDDDDDDDLVLFCRWKFRTNVTL
jgi:hypothetical protein